jgi:hypothetical protein
MGTGKSEKCQTNKPRTFEPSLIYIHVTEVQKTKKKCDDEAHTQELNNRLIFKTQYTMLAS